MEFGKAAVGEASGAGVSAVGEDLTDTQISSLSTLYGEACEDAKRVYRQFNPQTDAPTIKNNSINDAAVSNFSFIDISELSDELSEGDQSFDLNCVNFNPDCEYNLTPVYMPGTTIPLGYIRTGTIRVDLGGACTGISNLVGYFFSNANYTGGTCMEELSDFPDRLDNQCFDVACPDFNSWFSEKEQRIVGGENIFINESELYSRILTESGVGNLDVCEKVIAVNSPYNIFSEVGLIDRDSIRDAITGANLRGVTSHNLDLSPRRQEQVNLFNRTLGNRGYLYGRHFDILDNLIAGQISMISTINHRMFTYSCNSDLSLNTFDPNYPSIPIIIYKMNNGLWSFHREARNNNEQYDLTPELNECLDMYRDISKDMKIDFDEDEIRENCLRDIIPMYISNDFFIVTSYPAYHPLNECR